MRRWDWRAINHALFLIVVPLAVAVFAFDVFSNSPKAHASPKVVWPGHASLDTAQRFGQISPITVPMRGGRKVLCLVAITNDFGDAVAMSCDWKDAR